MSDPEILETLQASTESVLGTMFFADPVIATEFAITDGLRAQVDFRGEPPGSFELLISKPAACEIAANFLGLAPNEVSAEKVSDVVREMTNMLCGSALSQLECDSAFELSAPRIIPATESEVPKGAYRRAFHLETGGLAICLQLFRNTPR